MGKASELAHVCKVLSVEARVEILEMVKDRALCVGALAAGLDVTQGAVSQHLRILRGAGLVTAEKRGYFIHYSLAPDAPARCRAVMDSLFGTKPGSKKGGQKCVAEKRSAKGRRN